MNARPLADRFWARVRGAADGCWIFTGSRHAKGYGAVYVAPRKYVRATRFVWELLHGPIPRGLFVCHHCDNPPCVRPDHLFLGTNRDNMHDALAKGRPSVLRGLKGERQPAAKLTETIVRDMRAEYRARRATITQLARRYGVHPKTARDAVLGHNWSHIEHE